MENNSLHLLEQYVVGKDQDKYQILETIYGERAELEFEINSTNIDFPRKIVGHKAIAKTLSADFNKKYEKVKTYYLSNTFTDKFKILKQPWLVVMKEIGNELTRVGSGFYNWEFMECNNQLKIIKHKIYIHTMLEIHDPQSKQLQQIQQDLEYPWVESNVVVSVIKSYKNLTDVTNYLK
jgi:hypothetical protein